MANIMDYMNWRGDLSLKVSPFNEVDNLILTQIVYLDLDGIVPGINSSSRITVWDAAAIYFEKYPLEQVEELPELKRDASLLLYEMANSVRFSNCLLSKYVQDISQEEESQFTVMKIDLEDGSVFISFSGTDHSLVGWKENFNMSFLSETPGQLKAVRYVEETVPFYKNKLRFGGHSKGGNLAVYAAMHCRKSIQNRLLAVYNNDGPGFTKKMVSKEGYQRILGRIHTFVPQSSVVGMLLEHEEEMEVIESTSTGIMQHNAFSWKVKRTSFVYMEELENQSIFLDKTIKNWIDDLDETQREKFVDAVFQALENAGIEDTDNLRKLSFSQFVELVKGIEGLTKEEREAVVNTLWKLLGSAGEVGRSWNWKK